MRNFSKVCHISSEYLCKWLLLYHYIFLKNLPSFIYITIIISIVIFTTLEQTSLGSAWSLKIGENWSHDTDNLENMNLIPKLSFSVQQKNSIQAEVISSYDSFKSTEKRHQFSPRGAFESLKYTINTTNEYHE